jgi:hypothetical protein
LSNAFTLRRKQVDNQEAVIGRVITVGAILLAAGLVAYILTRFLFLPLTTIRRLIVESDIPLTESEVLTQAGLRGDERYYTLQTAAIQKRLEANPLVRRARVEKIFPDTLRVVIYRREAVALLLAKAGGRSVLVLVDAEGTTFKLGSSGAEVDLPVISGVNMGEVTLGTPLPAAYRSIFADLAALRAKFPAMFRLISEVKIVASSGSSGAPMAVGTSAALAADVSRTSSVVGTYELLLYLVSSPVRIRARAPIDDMLLKSSLTVLDVLSNQGVLEDIEELDLRGADAVYRTKEE